MLMEKKVNSIREVKSRGTKLLSSVVSARPSTDRWEKFIDLMHKISSLIWKPKHASVGHSEPSSYCYSCGEYLSCYSFGEMSAEEWAERKTEGLIKPHLNHENTLNRTFSRLIKINLNDRTQVYLCHPMSQYFKAGDEEKKAKNPQQLHPAAEQCLHYSSSAVLWQIPNN